MPNRSAVPADMADWLFLVRQAIALEAAFQDARGKDKQWHWFDSSQRTRRAFWCGFRAAIWKAEDHPAHLRYALQQRAEERNRQRELARRIAVIDHYETYWIDRFAHISAANFIRRLGQTDRPMIAPNIADPAYRDAFMRRHGIGPFAQQEHRA